MDVSKRFAALGLGVVLGCGGDGDGTGSSGVAPTNELRALGPSEVQQLCDWVREVSESGLRPTRQQGCTFVALSLSDNPADCTELLNACVSAPDQAGEEAPADEEADCNVAALQSDLGDCTATVAEYEACVRAAIDDVAAVLASLSCEQAGMSDPGAQDEVVLAECEVIETKCPGLDGS